MAHATPTSPWQPTSAPEIDAFFFTILPTKPAVANARRILFLLNSRLFFKWYSTAGTTPQEPQVGAVTISPPAAFSSDTANAYANINPLDRKEALCPFALMW